MTQKGFYENGRFCILNQWSPLIFYNLKIPGLSKKTSQSFKSLQFFYSEVLDKKK
jgi:hypothetical protein